MNYEQMISTARDVKTSDEWLFDVAQKIMPGATELIVAIAENPNASEATIIELCLSVLVSRKTVDEENVTDIKEQIRMNRKFWEEYLAIEKPTGEAVAAIVGRINCECALDELAELLKKNTYNWEVEGWEALKDALMHNKNVAYLQSKFPEIFTMEYPGVNTDISEWQKREWRRWDELDEYYASLKESMTPQEWEAFEDEMLADPDDDDCDFDDDEFEEETEEEKAHLLKVVAEKAKLPTTSSDELEIIAGMIDGNDTDTVHAIIDHPNLTNATIFALLNKPHQDAAIAIELINKLNFESSAYHSDFKSVVKKLIQNSWNWNGEAWRKVRDALLFNCAWSEIIKNLFPELKSCKYPGRCLNEGKITTIYKE